MTSPQLKSKKNYTILKPLGVGGFGTVFKIKVHEDNKDYAVKYVQLNQPDDLVEAEMEYNLLRKGIPNVLKSFGSHHEPNKTFIFSTELMEMTLQNFIDDNGPIPFEKFIPIFKNIITGKILIISP
jgi:serine/threonine protein kinase